MQDITLCRGGECPIKFRCFRFTAETLGKQDFFKGIPFNANKNSCEYFIGNFHQIQKVAYYIWLEKGKPSGKSDEIWLEAERRVWKNKL
ncbi:MAG: hypothetical protein OHK0038_23680 [Flammeovirgaceae bacterium]